MLASATNTIGITACLLFIKRGYIHTKAALAIGRMLLLYGYKK